MKILIISARYRPETFSIGPIAEHLVELGHDVTVLTGVPHYGLGRVYDGYQDVYEQTIAGVKVIRVKEHVRKASTKSLIANYISIYRKFPKKLKKIDGDFDIVLSHVISPIWSMRGVRKYCNKHHIPHMHYGLDLWPESFVASGYLKRKSVLFKILKNYSARLYRTCDLICFASPCTESYFKDYLKVDVPFKHIYQPCLTKQPDFSLVEKHEFTKEGKRKILFCGTIAKFTHLEFIISAFKNPQIRSNFILDVVGSGSELENAKELVKENELTDSIIFHGRVPSEETVNYYLNADILFAPLYKNSITSDMIPQKVIEYFMYGKPILGMLSGDGKALIEKASDLNVICDQTVESMTQGLLKLSMYSSEQLKDCGKQNYDFYKNGSRFSLDSVCKELLESMSELIEKRAKEK